VFHWTRLLGRRHRCHHIRVIGHPPLVNWCADPMTNSLMVGGAAHLQWRQTDHSLETKLCGLQVFYSLQLFQSRYCPLAYAVIAYTQLFERRALPNHTYSLIRLELGSYRFGQFSHSHPCLATQFILSISLSGWIYYLSFVSKGHLEISPLTWAIPSRFRIHLCVTVAAARLHVNEESIGLSLEQHLSSNHQIVRKMYSFPEHLR